MLGESVREALLVSSRTWKIKYFYHIIWARNSVGRVAGFVRSAYIEIYDVEPLCMLEHP